MIFFFFNDTATTEIYTLSLHDALPISPVVVGGMMYVTGPNECFALDAGSGREIWHYKRRRTGTMSVGGGANRSEEHTSELQSQSNLVCRLLLEKKKKYMFMQHSTSIAL